MAIDIKCNTTYAETAHQLWVELEQRFAQQNAPRIFEIKQAITTLLQNQDPVSTYFSKLKTLLDELMNYEAIPNCSYGGLKTVVQNLQRDWVMKFLMGLNDSYREIKAQILLIKPFPSLNEVYSIIQQEEKRREISTEGIAQGAASESMALITKRNYKEKGKQNIPAQRRGYFCTFCKIAGHSVEKCFKANPGKPICSYCRVPGHCADKCYKLHGYQLRHKVEGKNRPSANQSIASLPTAQEMVNDKPQVSLSQEQYSHLMALLKPATSSQYPNYSVNDVQGVATSSPTDENIHQLSGMSLCMSTFKLKSLDISQVPWILDTGVTDHMICSTSLFTSIHAEVSYMVTLPNVNKVPVTHIGTVKITDTLILQNVLCVPNFSYNLISTKKLSQMLHCCLIFFPHCCYIQDLSVWRTIGMGEVKEGLYHMRREEVACSTLSDHLTKLNILPSTYVSASITKNVQNLDIWHYRLGHSSCTTRDIDGDIHFSKSSNDTPCSICPLAKLHKPPFPVSVHRAEKCSDLLHCDTWGPCNEVGSDGSKYFLTIVDDFSRCTWAYMLKLKSDATAALQSFCRMVETQFETKVKIIQTDNGGEFNMRDFYLK
ncbi:uncharacterized protein LOC111408533 [Olea europaea var. sylvestris]|uniref:uncharacterized protein LOC111408533 n=1 Tax=Olea europaea var. sylvestris TaxID=158386 RepID=UPI000C1D5B0E|nr:uncharacterized protein LOC111408533 [Olea europaea var. sylvestris]